MLHIILQAGPAAINYPVIGLTAALTALGAVVSISIARRITVEVERGNARKRELATMRKELTDVHRHLVQSRYVVMSLGKLLENSEFKDGAKRPMNVVFTKLKLPEDTRLFQGTSFQDLPEDHVAAMHQLRLRLRNINLTAEHIGEFCWSERFEKQVMEKHLNTLADYMKFVADKQVTPCIQRMYATLPESVDEQEARDKNLEISDAQGNVIGKKDATDKTADIILEKYVAPKKG